jgi:hypothetical protein
MATKAHRQRMLRHLGREQLMSQLRESVRQIEDQKRPPPQGGRTERAQSWNDWVRGKTGNRDNAR